MCDKDGEWRGQAVWTYNFSRLNTEYANSAHPGGPSIPYSRTGDYVESSIKTPNHVRVLTLKADSKPLQSSKAWQTMKASL